VRQQRNAFPGYTFDRREGRFLAHPRSTWTAHEFPAPGTALQTTVRDCLKVEIRVDYRRLHYTQSW
jgi:hypothetical protein